MKRRCSVCGREFQKVALHKTRSGHRRLLLPTYVRVMDRMKSRRAEEPKP